MDVEVDVDNEQQIEVWRPPKLIIAKKRNEPQPPIAISAATPWPVRRRIAVIGVHYGGLETEAAKLHQLSYARRRKPEPIISALRVKALRAAHSESSP